jgi:hypothetical protein
MRLGCSGCLVVPVLLLLTAAVGGATWTAARLFRPPEIPVWVPTAAESRRAQQKLFEIVRRPPRSGESGTDVVTFSEKEVNALISRHLVEVGGVAVKNSFVRLVGTHRVDIYGSLPLGDVLDAVGPATISRQLPASWVTRPVWWHLTTRLRATGGSDGRRRLYLDAESLTLGDQPVPVALTRLLLPPRVLELLRLDLPAGVDSVTVEPGKVVVRGRAAP